MKDIAKMLLEVKAVSLDTSKGFTYASGRKGPIYCDNRLLLSYPKQRELVMSAFLQVIKEKNLAPDVVAGVATGAIAWGALIADRLKKPFIYIRSSTKGHGKQNRIEGRLEEGKKVLVIEDLINTGGSSADACNAVREGGGIVIACIAIVNYGFDEAGKKFTSGKIPLYSLTDFTELINVASESKTISGADKKVLFAWHKDPENWN